jgi:SAM-dependent methyltransferase
VRTKAKPTPKGFDKYYYYLNSVQNPSDDAEFFHKTYKQIKKKNPKTLREDFCGTFAICCEWVRREKYFVAYGVDLDQEPIEYGTQHYLPQLSEDQQSRVHILNKNVLDKKIPPTDIIAALNFSYYLFKKREMLKKYFENCYRTLNKDGIFIIDCFGGGQCQAAIEEESKYEGFSYFWDQINFNPITNEAEFFIHFKPNGKPKIEKAFYYDWRMWAIPELTDILQEVGFKKTQVYWEGNDNKGGGNGVFTPSEIGEECDSWIAYIVSEK